jgi:hypothetical protein
MDFDNQSQKVKRFSFSLYYSRLSIPPHVYCHCHTLKISRSSSVRECLALMVTQTPRRARDIEELDMPTVSYFKASKRKFHWRIELYRFVFLSQVRKSIIAREVDNLV